MSRREDAINWLKYHPREDITTKQVAEELGCTQAQAAQTLHGLQKYGLGGQFRRTGQSTWIYVPPDEFKVVHQHDTTTDIPLGFKGEVQVVAKMTLPAGGHKYLLAVLRDGSDTGLRLLADPISETAVVPPDGATYHPVNHPEGR